MKRNSGMTLIEILVTLLVLSIGLLGLSGLQATAVKDELDIASRSQVTWIVNEIVERIRATKSADLISDPYEEKNIDTLRDQYPITFNAPCAAPTTTCSDTNSANASQCTAAQVALQDIRETFCTQTDLLNLQSVSITCSGACAIDSDITVSVSWTSKNVTSSQAMTDSEVNTHQTSTISMTVRP